VYRPSAFEPPVFVGFAYHNEETGWDDLDGLPLEGRLAVMMSGSPTPDLVPLLPEVLPSGPTASETAEMAKLDRLAEEGVSAVLVVPEGWIIENWQDFWAMWRRVGVFPVETYTSQGRPLEPTLPVLVAHPDLVDRLFLDQSFHPISKAGRYETFEIRDTDARIHLDVERIGLTSANVVGIVPGTDPILRAEYVVVSAHLDGQGGQGTHVYNSANDDASGCAAILELAEAVAASPLPRSVLFALFTAEEAGHLGSLHFLAHPPVPRDAITAVINVEQVGRVTPEARGFEAIGSEDLLPSIRRAGERIGTSLRVVSISENWEAMQGSDAATFVGSGIPTVLLGGGGFPEYHSPEDDPDLIDGAHLLEAARILRALVEEMAGWRGENDR
jgi:hypothetical protein